MAEEISNSKKKRIERKEKNNKNKRDKMIATVISALVAVVFIGFIAYIVYANVKKEAIKVTPVASTTEFSKGLSDEGKIEGITATNCVTLPDYAAYKVPQSEIECSDEDIQSIIDSTLEDNTELSNEEGLEVKDGDKINLDYAGTIDGVAFDGGTAEQYDLTIGSGTFIPGFEDQLIGAKIGENLDVTVTFPEEYQTEELQGKEAVFNCTINGIYVKPEFDDDFVKNVLELDKTAEEYKADKKAEKEEENKKSYVESHFTEGVTVTEYPKNYLENVKKVQRYTDIQNYNMMNQFYAQYQGQGFSSFEDYIVQVGQAENMTQYYENLADEAKNTVRDNLVFQGVADSLQITVTEDDVKESINGENDDEEAFTTQVEAYGLPYLAQQVMKDKVLEYVCEHAVVE